jgi:predicted phage terminase large subunit-like protein
MVMGPANQELVELGLVEPGVKNFSPTDEMAALELAENYAKAEERLGDFVRQAWKVIEGRPFADNWHIDVICEHLEALATGQIRRLVINVPPRSTKSTIISVCFPAWCWIDDARWQFLTGSHNKDLAIRDAVKSRRLLDSPWFRRAWGDRFRLTTDQNQKARYENNRGGYRVVFGYGSGVTGEGGDFLLNDDPHPARSSAADFENDAEFFDQELSTRLNDPETGRIGVIMQRLGPRDLTGHLLEQSGWVHLMLPLEFEPERRCHTVLGPADPRTVEGQVLDPKRWPLKTIADMKVHLGAHGAAGQLQQRPVPKGGGQIKLADFQEFIEPPARHLWLRSMEFWDTAGTDTKKSSHWAGLYMVQTQDMHLWLMDLIHKRFGYPEGRRAVGNFYHKHNPDKAFIENKSTGISLLGERLEHEDLAGCNLLGYDPCTDKNERMYVETGAIEAGRVHVMKNAPWRFEFNQAIEGFPNGINQDIIDVFSMALYHFHRRRLYRVRSA